jgi:hypothetical protein
MPQPNAQWYDMATLDEMHADLKTEYLKTLAVITNRPMLLKHFHSCTECQTIKTAQEGATEAPAEMPHRELLRRRKIFLLTTGDLTKILGLPPNAGVLFARVTGESDVIEITACSPDYDIVEYGSQPFVSVLEAS